MCRLNEVVDSFTMPKERMLAVLSLLPGGDSGDADVEDDLKPSLNPKDWIFERTEKYILSFSPSYVASPDDVQLFAHILVWTGSSIPTFQKYTIPSTSLARLTNMIES